MVLQRNYLDVYKYKQWSNKVPPCARANGAQPSRCAHRAFQRSNVANSLPTPLSCDPA